MSKKEKKDILSFIRRLFDVYSFEIMPFLNMETFFFFNQNRLYILKKYQLYIFLMITPTRSHIQGPSIKAVRKIPQLMYFSLNLYGIIK